MNLLRDSWIPVRNGIDFKQITYKELLCSEQPNLQVALPRDDFELACIQMLAAMTQVIFMPLDRKELRARIEVPLSEKEYASGIKKFDEWFDLNHPKWPFMQINDPGTDKSTPIQKIFSGLPAGNNHAFFNEKNECEKVCPSCAAIGLFNLCTLAPNISGKHKGGLRGGAPVSTILYDASLRRMVWMNVLTKEWVERIMSGKCLESPVWVEQIKQREKIPAISIGLIRGLFWTPIHVKLLFNYEPLVCDCCGVASSRGLSLFLLGSNLKFEICGLWPHPYSPRQLNLQKENKGGKEKAEESVVSFRTTEPAWTQFSELLFQADKTDKKEGYVPAAVISQYSDLFSNQTMHLIVGGYRTKQAAILQRRHELYSMPAGWNTELKDRIIEIIESGIAIENILTDKVLYHYFIKGTKEKGGKAVGIAINKEASGLYYQLTESFIHRMLQETSQRGFVYQKKLFLDDLFRICLEIFERVTHPYSHKQEFIGTIALARAKLVRLLKKEAQERATVEGGEIDA